MIIAYEYIFCRIYNINVIIILLKLTFFNDALPYVIVGYHIQLPDASNINNLRSLSMMQEKLIVFKLAVRQEMPFETLY